MKYLDTRGIDERILSACEAVLEGTTTSGGLWVPDYIPELKLEEANSYEEVALKVLDAFGFVGKNAIPLKDAQDLIHNAYKNFWHKEKVELQNIAQTGNYFLNLHYGPTCAFKDYALSLVGQIIPYLLKKKGYQGVSLGATSGDTGPAAMANVANENLFVHILYPHGGTSVGQEQQMIHYSGKNAQAYAMDGFDFDGCQSLVKEVFSDQDFLNKLENSGKKLISVNSINWLRIVGQVIYVVYTVSQLNQKGIIPNLVIPSGNSGHWVAAWIAKEMGIEIGEIILASNRNNLITEFVNYGRHFPEKVIQTIAPAMDISISSNLERALYFIFGSEATHNFMINHKGKFQLNPTELKIFQSEVSAFSAQRPEIISAIKQAYENGIIIDPHTAVGFDLYNQGLCDTEEKYVFFSTAHPCKFTDTVTEALATDYPDLKMQLEYEIIDSLPQEAQDILTMSEEEITSKRRIVKFSKENLEEIILTD